MEDGPALLLVNSAEHNHTEKFNFVKKDSALSPAAELILPVAKIYMGSQMTKVQFLAKTSVSKAVQAMLRLAIEENARWKVVPSHHQLLASAVKNMLVLAM